MNINDRRRISALINSEFCSRMAAATREPTADEIAKEVDSIISKNRLKDKVAKLLAARQLVETLDKQLSVAVASLRTSPAKKRRGRYDGCECHDDYADVLQEIAKSNLIEARGSKDYREKLKTEERKLLAKVEIAKSVEDVEKIIKAAGLIG